jgi:hypothetical protein
LSERERLNAYWDNVVERRQDPGDGVPWDVRWLVDQWSGSGSRATPETQFRDRLWLQLMATPVGAHPRAADETPSPRSRATPTLQSTVAASFLALIVVASAVFAYHLRSSATSSTTLSDGSMSNGMGTPETTECPVDAAVLSSLAALSTVNDPTQEVGGADTRGRSSDSQ